MLFIFLLTAILELTTCIVNILIILMLNNMKYGMFTLMIDFFNEIISKNLEFTILDQPKIYKVGIYQEYQNITYN